MKKIKIEKVLIANRGEIALRIVKTCKELGIKTVTIYTEIEEEYPHRFISDEAYSLGSGALSETYLNQDKIIQIAKECGASAIHPGYGFLSENSGFAKAVTAAGIKFIGPSPASMDLMGDKISSKIKMEQVGIPLIPGYHGKNQDKEFLKNEAASIGYPVLIKASAGGGGKGMRIVEKESEFFEGLDSAKREAMNAFGNDIVLIEKYITGPRHIEVQVMSDTHGNHLHFFERECSIQRRHQKVIEETPSTALTPKLRQEITETAVKISTAINYEGAGTIEYILDTDGKFYFLEMNTRLQVEHPVTEFVTGYDLVKLQLIVASGEKLEIAQNDIKQSGHAIETRIYFEDPDNNFMPAIGKIDYIGAPTASNTRLDCGYTAGNEVTIHFDPMGAKLIAWDQTRALATKKILESLDEVVFFGVKTNREYLKRLLGHPAFVSGETFTHFIETYHDDLQKGDIRDEDIALAIGAFLFNEQECLQQTPTFTPKSPWDSLTGFRNV